MFYYFGYGSNINSMAMKAKGVLPINSQRAVLYGWQLCFNVKHWFRHEGGMGNIRYTGINSDYTEGVIHSCDDKYLPKLDAMEAYGVGYDRIIVNPDAGNDTIEAWAYIGLPAFIDEKCLPTQRYLNIIISGAKEAGLSQDYINHLKGKQVFNLPNYPPFQAPDVTDKIYTLQELIQNKRLTALAEFVFDMSKARKELHVLHNLFGGKDMTVFHLCRHDTANGNETLADFYQGKITSGQKAYINAYLHEYNHEFKYAGRLERPEIYTKYL